MRAERILHYLYLLRLRGELRVPEQLVLWIRDERDLNGRLPKR